MSASAEPSDVPDVPDGPLRHPEHRFGVAIAVAVALVIYGIIPSPVVIVPNWVIVVVGVCMIVPLVALNPTQFRRETMWARVLSISFGLLLTIINQITIVLTFHQLIVNSAKGPAVLLTAAGVWMTNAIAFSLIYWDLDLGGPFQRRLYNARDKRMADFRFPQHDGAPGNKYWEPGYFDYFYFSLSNQMAFSATDVMPMTSRAKALMAYQAVGGFIMLALVISRAVNILA